MVESFKDKVLFEIENRLRKLNEELRELELRKVEKQGEFNALFRLSITLKNHVRFDEPAESETTSNT